MSEHRSVVAVHGRERSAYSTSYAIDELIATLSDGSTRRLLHKQLSVDALLPEAQGNRPAFLVDPTREIAVYRHILPRAGLGTAVCHAAGEDSLLLEKVDGVELWQVGDRRVWRAVAAWLPVMHDRLGRSTGPEVEAHLVRYDRGYYDTWARRAEQFTDRSAGLGSVLERHPRVVDALVDLPVTIVHGEFFASNILVTPDCEPMRICPVDWEMAGRGPALVDLAALASGWDEEERLRLADAYAAAAGRLPDDVRAELDLCLVHVSMRALGWAPRWHPPAEHRQDWLELAARAMDRLGL